MEGFVWEQLQDELFIPHWVKIVNLRRRLELLWANTDVEPLGVDGPAVLQEPPKGWRKLIIVFCQQNSGPKLLLEI